MNGIPNEKRRAVIYTRVSSKEQVEEGNSLATQEDLCRQYALEHGLEVVDVYEERGESAKTQDRPKLKSMLEFCVTKANRISIVLVYRLDRLSRNVGDYTQIKIMLQKYKVEVCSITEPIEDSPVGRFVELIHAGMSQLDNDIRAERCLNALKKAMKEGRYVWKAPLGYTNTLVNGKSNIVPDSRAPLIRKMFELTARYEATLEDIRKEINEEGLRSISHKPIPKSQFYRLLRTETYAGWIQKYGERHKGAFEPIVSEEIYSRVQRVLAGRTRRTLHYQNEHPDFPLRRFFKHPNGEPLTGNWSKGRSQRYPYYRFKRLSKHNFRKAYVDDKFVELLNQYQFSPSSLSKFRNYVRQNLIYKLKDENKRYETLKAAIEVKKNEQLNLSKQLSQRLISESTFKRLMDRLDFEIEQSEVELARCVIRTPKENWEEILNDVAVFLKTPGNTWKNAEFMQQLRLQWFAFPKGISFDGKKCRTAEICNIFKAKREFSGTDSHMGCSSNRNSNQETFDAISSSEIGSELSRLSKILKGYYD